MAWAVCASTSQSRETPAAMGVDVAEVGKDQQRRFVEVPGELGALLLQPGEDGRLVLGIGFRASP